MGDNVLSPDRASLANGIMKEYENDISKIVERGIPNWGVSTDTYPAFPFLLI